MSRIFKEGSAALVEIILFVKETIKFNAHLMMKKSKKFFVEIRGTVEKNFGLKKFFLRNQKILK